jgi:hypothetical protein
MKSLMQLLSALGSMLASKLLLAAIGLPYGPVNGGAIMYHKGGEIKAAMAV